MRISSEEFVAAVKQGDAPRVRSMLASSPGLASARDGQETSVPLIALFHRKKEIADLLVAAKEELEPLDVFEASALGRADRLKAILSERPDLANACAGHGFFPLALAAFYGREEAAKLLLASGADPDLSSRNPMKVRALHAAAASRSLAIARELIAAGADVNAPQEQGFRPLHEAAQSGQVDLARLLIRAGADPNVRSDDGRTPLDLARKAGHVEVVSILTASLASSSGR